MKTILVSTIINKVKEKLYRYFENDTIDDAILYNKFENLKSEFRLNDYPEGCSVMVVENYKATLPDDFHKACLLLACYEQQTISSSRYNETFCLEERQVTEIEACKNVYEYCKDDCGNLISIVQKFNRYDFGVYQHYEVLGLTKDSVKFCEKDCINRYSGSRNMVNIVNGEIITEFETGTIYMEYIKSLDIGHDYEIPYHPKVSQWLESEFILEIFETLWMNGETDVQQRYQVAKQNAQTHYFNAIKVLRTPHRSEFYNLANNLINRYNFIRDNVWNPDIHTENYYYKHPYWDKIDTTYATPSNK